MSEQEPDPRVDILAEALTGLPPMGRTADEASQNARRRSRGLLARLDAARPSGEGRDLAVTLRRLLAATEIAGGAAQAVDRDTRECVVEAVHEQMHESGWAAEWSEAEAMADVALRALAGPGTADAEALSESALGLRWRVGDIGEERAARLGMMRWSVVGRAPDNALPDGPDVVLWIAGGVGVAIGEALATVIVSALNSEPSRAATKVDDAAGREDLASELRDLLVRVYEMDPAAAVGIDRTAYRLQVIAARTGRPYVYPSGPGGEQ